MSLNFWAKGSNQIIMNLTVKNPDIEKDHSKTF